MFRYARGALDLQLPRFVAGRSEDLTAATSFKHQPIASRRLWPVHLLVIHKSMFACGCATTCGHIVTKPTAIAITIAKHINRQCCISDLNQANMPQNSYKENKNKSQIMPYSISLVFPFQPLSV